MFTKVMAVREEVDDADEGEPASKRPRMGS